MRKETVSIPGPRILVIRLGAMGDIIHALPAVATLKHSFPRSHITWVCDSKWTPLLEGNPFVDDVLALERRTMGGLAETWRRLRHVRFDMAVDFQGLMKSALMALVAKADRVCGFDYSAVRERLAALAYSTRVKPTREHVVERCLELAGGCGARNILSTFPLPAGAPEGVLPEGWYVLATPLAGWPAKQWPLEFYSALGARLREAFGVSLVLNAPEAAREALGSAPEVSFHGSGLAGLIHATRKAVAIVGVDSGPMHLAAALGKPGVAIFGPTSPVRNGPYSPAFKVLRSPRAQTSYKRLSEIDPSMREVTPAAVYDALAPILLERMDTAHCSA